jgi:hypothetical protein
MEVEGAFLVCTLSGLSAETIDVAVHKLRGLPFAIAECKRVGIEEGNKKGPQTIEKAKQGAYVARSVSSLQKIRLANGQMGGVMQKDDGSFVHKPYRQFLEEVVASHDAELLRQFIITAGVVSNHGNWFTSANHNKELKVLASSYDWLLFLTDEGLSEFVDDLIVRPQTNRNAVREAFLRSYTGQSGKNQFTKVKMNLEADAVLQGYFSDNATHIHDWFNVITPHNRDLASLREELHILAGKKWDEIHR